MHGYSVEELMGQDVSVFCLTGYRRAVPVEELNRMTSWRRESVNVRKDGSLLPVMLMSDVVLDMTMNGKDPFDQIHRTSPTTPVIVMSGEAEQAAWQAYFGKAPPGSCRSRFAPRR